jgi:hypothetical protein
MIHQKEKAPSVKEGARDSAQSKLFLKNGDNLSPVPKRAVTALRSDPLTGFGSLLDATTWLCSVVRGVLRDGELDGQCRSAFRNIRDDAFPS